MRTPFLLLVVALAALAETRGGNHKSRAKRELLVRSKRRWVLSTIELSEEDPGPYPKVISQMFNDKISKASQNHKFVISGMGVTENPMGVFRIDEKTGEVQALRPIDREQYEMFHIKFDILDKVTGEKIDRELAFDVEIKDINDNAPKFLKPIIHSDVKENMPEGYLPAQLQAVDIDQKNTSNSKVTISLQSQKPAEPKIGLTQLDDRTAQLTFKGCFNYDKIKKYEVIVQAQDHGTPILSSSATVILNIVDANSHPPMFKKKEYQGEVQESTTKNDVLRVAVEDKDSPKTPGWRAKYFFIKGNEEGNYKIETDPETNEGILSVIKGKDFERTTLTNIEIGVQNEEPLYVCTDNSPAKGTFADSVNVTVKVIDVNDPPQFEKDKVDIYRIEEESPGKELFTPKVNDVDSDVTKIRYVLLKDPANWMAIDKKTGKVTTTAKMDRESPFVDSNDVYQIIVGAIDDGEPPATGTCTVLVHLGDINDNVPKLTNGSLVICGNMTNKVKMSAKDADRHPFSGPFAFSLGGKGKSTEDRWKVDRAFGEEASLVILKPLPNGNYSVPLTIQDQQNVVGHDTLELTVCDCHEENVCRSKEPFAFKLWGALGGITCGALLFLLLLLIFKCTCQKKFMQVPPLADEGNQTLINYNQEGGGAECTAEPVRLLTPTNGVDKVDYKKSQVQVSQMAPVTMQTADIHNSAFTTVNINNYNSLGMQRDRDLLRSSGGRNEYCTWSSRRTNTYQGSSSMYHQSSSLRPYTLLAEHISRRISVIDENVEYKPREYAYEGQDTRCYSLDELSVSGDDLQFLDTLGPKFNVLEGICREACNEKKILY